MSEDIFDLIIIGGGPAGLTAGMYASRARLNCVLFEKMMPGGQVLFTDVIENFPGFSKPIKGPDLIKEIVEQAKRSGLKIVNEGTLKISHTSQNGHNFIIECDSKKRYKTLSLIIAAGAVWKKLGVQGEENLIGKGVSYCATCDGPFFKGRDVIVVGGGDRALEESLFLSKFTNSVKLVHRRDQFRAVKELQERVFENEKITPIYDSVITEVGGRNSVEFVKVTNTKTKKVEIVSCGAIFIFIGIDPNSATVKGLVNIDEKGFVIVDKEMKTSQEGIYACGDIIKKDLYQIVTAVGEGATAAFNAQRYIEGLKNKVF
ncbi:MAG: thioredoxin-disulfide reductase [Candidatus Omnitrophica bacterium]|nr:thioredoxin-disulfide reductase [Candidatus Omnitrophota bacterium]